MPRPFATLQRRLERHPDAGGNGPAAVSVFPVTGRLIAARADPRVQRVAGEEVRADQVELRVGREPPRRAEVDLGADVAVVTLDEAGAADVARARAHANDVDRARGGGTHGR